MEEMLKPYLIELLELVKSTGSFIIGELPAISKEIITWGIVRNIVPIVVLFIALLILMIVATKIKKSTDVSEHKFFETNSYDEFEHIQALIYVIIAIISLVILIIWLIITCFNIQDICKAIFAPRLFLIEQLQLLLE